ncbi:type II toxin-antitoxin system Phd/YefM family antitoxin [Pseudomonas sp. B21-056]|jgi:antitoxin StbD|uniref:type II toxin-antitoxin system Phd/YefM family antitoxin n=1 Tax=Pseudomonas sp. B21-056 TaxID=2895495 RepID=UPI00222FB7BE|nr:type II toxin-antitoxin system Phd/YefM family antitoxin [Pseudomonas sp. B21-056]UZE25870.1 type II toxin-antitoxin system Phd/YefM family antitoxin [Pseudomonas sp. B21-056]
MTRHVLSQVVTSVAEFKKDPMGIVAAGEGSSVAILNCNVPVFYCVPAREYELMMDRLEDFELVVLCVEREKDPTFKVSFEDL